MYSAVFESKNGEKYVFGVNGGTVFDMDVASGASIDIGTSQGFTQIGETVESQKVSGKVIAVNGVIYQSVNEMKNRMRRVFAPFASGRLVFEGKYYIYVYVKSTPTFSPVKGNGKFSMQLFAPYPFFLSLDEKSIGIGAIEPKFSFPVNYEEPHIFGLKQAEKYKNVFNAGDVIVPFKVTMAASGTSENPTITNLKSSEFLKLNGTLNVGDSVAIYRDDQGVLRAELKSNGESIDIISWIDEKSSLFDLAVGDNLISATDERGGDNLSTRFYYNPAVVSVYES